MTDPLPRPRVAYLGPAGTFTEQALVEVPWLADHERVPLASMSDVLFAVHDGDVEMGIVAIENAIEGTVNVTIDSLAFDVDVQIVDEVVLSVRMDLLARPGARLEEIKKVLSIPVASAQCRTWMRANLPHATAGVTSSTAEAAELVAALDDPSVAAIANPRAGEVYGLEPVATDIEDHSANKTRFVVIARRGVPAPTGHDKTSLVVFQRADVPGSLLAILQEFAARRINLTLLLSRPTKSALGDYCFVIDLEGHVADEVVADCLKRLKATQADVKFLGSYPAAGHHGEAVRREADAAAESAEAWLAGLRAQID